VFQDVICTVVQDYLRDNFPLRPDQCYVTLDERPFPDRGDLSFCVYPGSATPGPSEDQQVSAAEMEVSFFIGLTRSIGQVPRDRYFKFAYADIRGLVPLARRVFGILRRDRLIVQEKINNGFSALENETFSWKLVDPFMFLGFTATPTEVDPTHFHRDPRRSEKDSIHGLWLPMEFGNSRIMGKDSGAGYDFGYDLGFES